MSSVSINELLKSFQANIWMIVDKKHRELTNFHLFWSSFIRNPDPRLEPMIAYDCLILSFGRMAGLKVVWPKVIFQEQRNGVKCFMGK